jgi:hypothetical protein
MWVLIIILVLFALILMGLTYLNRRNKTEETEIKINNDGECCGAHEVCDRESLLNSDDKIEYFDDEELDFLADIQPEKLSDSQVKQLSDVFFTLKESDVAAWLRSLQMRRIQLPFELREQALLVVSERRGL